MKEDGRRGSGLQTEGSDWVRDGGSALGQRGQVEWGEKGAWGPGLYPEGNEEVYRVEGGHKTGLHKDPSVSSVVGIGGPRWRWEEQLGGHGPHAVVMLLPGTHSAHPSVHLLPARDRGLSGCNLWSTKAVLLRENETTSGALTASPGWERW